MFRKPPSPLIDKFRNCLLGCTALALTAALLGVAGFCHFLFTTRKDESQSVANRFREVVENAKTRAVAAGSLRPPMLDPPRTWTDVDGRTLEGVLVDSERDTALIRVLNNQRVYRIPFQRLSAADRSYLENSAAAEKNGSYYPSVPSQWPVVLGGASAPPPIERLPDGNGWKSAHYDFVADETVDPEWIRELAHTCETVHRIAGQTPLPLRWGRPHDSRRQVKLYANDSEYSQSDTQENWAAYYSLLDNCIHIPITSLSVTRPIQGSSVGLNPRKSFKIIVHELSHQESVGLMAHNCPAWGTEGIAELFSAMQRAPGLFAFNNSQTSVHGQLNERFRLAEVGKLVGLPMPELRSFLYMELRDFNSKTAESEVASMVFYASALVLVEYFCFADGNSLRPYLEAVLTGVLHREATELHLLRGKTMPEIESAIAERWTSRGLRIRFEESPALRKSDRRSIPGYWIR